MSSNELYKNPIGVDVTLASGTGNFDLYANAKWFSPNTSKVVGVFLKTAGANVTSANNNNAKNVNVNIAITPNAANAIPTYSLTVKNNLSASDAGVYTVLFVNENKVSNFGSNVVYPC